MSTKPGDWDRDEREALDGLEDQLASMRRRHRADPPFELLRAARGDALPPDLQSAVSEHLSESAFSRALIEPFGSDEPELSFDDQDRLLTRIIKEARQTPEPARAWAWLQPLLVGSAVVAVASLVWVVAASVTSRSQVAAPTVAVSQPPPAPFLLPFDKPDVRIGMAALTWRGSRAGENQLLADLKPGLDAYRQDDFATANRELSALAVRYPGTIEIPFYQGVSRLFLNDLPGAIASLSAAEAVGDPTFASDVSWYRAVAEQRAGLAADARARLDVLCRAGGQGAARACAALDQLTAASPAAR